MQRTAAVAAFVVPLAVYGLVRIIDSSFSVRDHPGLFGLTILGSLRSLPDGTGLLGLHFSRTFVGIAGAVALIVGALAARRFSRGSSLPFAFWAALSAGIAVSGEAILLNPSWINGSEPLLAALGAAFLTIAGTVALGTLYERGWRIRPVPAAAAFAGLVLISLNHRYAAISPVSTAAAFAVRASAGAAISAVAVAIGARRR